MRLAAEELTFALTLAIVLHSAWSVRWGQGTVWKGRRYWAEGEQLTHAWERAGGHRAPDPASGSHTEFDKTSYLCYSIYAGGRGASVRMCYIAARLYQAWRRFAADRDGFALAHEISGQESKNK